MAEVILYIVAIILLLVLLTFETIEELRNNCFPYGEK